jgi:hypothetical protein
MVERWVDIKQLGFLAAFGKALTARLVPTNLGLAFCAKLGQYVSRQCNMLHWPQIMQQSLSRRKYLYSKIVAWSENTNFQPNIEEEQQRRMENARQFNKERSDLCLLQTIPDSLSLILLCRCRQAQRAQPPERAQPPQARTRQRRNQQARAAPRQPALPQQIVPRQPQQPQQHFQQLRYGSSLLS